MDRPIASPQPIALAQSEASLAARKRHIIPADLAEHILVWERQKGQLTSLDNFTASTFTYLITYVIKKYVIPVQISMNIAPILSPSRDPWLISVAAG